MPFRSHEVRTRAERNKLADSLIASALAAGKAIELVVADQDLSAFRKLELLRHAPVGVSVRTHEQLIGDLWELYGNGTKLVSSKQRICLVRSIIDDVDLLDSRASAKLVTLVAGFVAEAAAPGLQPKEVLSPKESVLMELVSLYQSALEQRGLVEAAQVEQVIDCDELAGRTFIFEEPDPALVHQQRFMRRLGASAPVHVLHESWDGAVDAGEGAASGDELAALRSMLYSGRGSLAAQGKVGVGLALGAHVTGDLLVQVIGRCCAAGARYGDILCAFADAGDAYPQVTDALARAGIPFKLRFKMQLAHTPFGTALIELLQGADDDASYEALSSFLMSPFSGVDLDEARAVQAYWRARGGSTPEQRRADIMQGYTAGHATSAQVRDALQPMADLLAASDGAERVRLMFAHAHEAHLGVEELVDARAAAEVALDYFETVSGLGVRPSIEDLSVQKVTLERSFGDEQDAVELGAASGLVATSVPYIILMDLDSAHFPMAGQPDALEDLRAKLGLDTPDMTAARQRLVLADLVEAARKGFTFCRSCHDRDGQKSCQSALFDELLAVYRSKRDDELGLPVQAVPPALLPYVCSVSEDEVFFAQEGQGEGQAQDALPGLRVVRGALAGEGAHAALCRSARGDSREFSPTQLEDYHRCPYRWFTSRRIGCNPLDRSFDQSALGTLFHDTMQRFYSMLKEVGHERVLPGNLEEALDVASRAFDAQLTASRLEAKKGMFTAGASDELQIEELKGLVLDFVRRDAEFLPGFVPTYFEVGLTSKYGPLEYATVPVRGAVDRIDVDAQGNAVVIDYKLSGLGTGYGLPGKVEPDDISVHVQTDIYARLVEKSFAMRGIELKVIGSVYRSYAKNVLRGVYDASLRWGPVEGVSGKNDGLPRADLPESYGEYLDRVEAAISADVQRLADGDIAPAPRDKEVCTYCKAQAFCPKAVS